ncbi:hypothetical protein PCLA_05f0450 [Pseudomonas citronellolis]|nr:hypothetical protein PCLA_05f0450 [Pseudomonas citronellolis]
MRPALAIRVIHLVVESAGHAELLVATSSLAIASPVPSKQSLGFQWLAKQARPGCATLVQPARATGRRRPFWRQPLQSRPAAATGPARLRLCLCVDGEPALVAPAGRG